MKEFLESFHDLVMTGIILAVALAIAFAAYVAVFALAMIVARRTHTPRGLLRWHLRRVKIFPGHVPSVVLGSPAPGGASTLHPPQYRRQ